MTWKKKASRAPRTFQVNQQLQITMRDAELVQKVAEARDWDALKELMGKWLMPSPSLAELADLPFDDCTILGTEIMDLITARASSARARMSMLESADRKKVH